MTSVSLSATSDRSNAFYCLLVKPKVNSLQGEYTRNTKAAQWAASFSSHRREIHLKGFTRFGSDLLSHALRRSTIGAKALNGRVRDGTGCFALAMTTKPRKTFGLPGVQASTRTVYASGSIIVWLLLDQIKPIGQLVPVN